MQPGENQPIRQYWQLCQVCLFPVLEERLGPLSENYRLLAAALAYLGDAGIAAPGRKRRGRRAHDRLPIFRAMLAKPFLNLVSTRQLLEQLRHDAALRQLCGWNSSRQVPGESVFSRVWAEWSGSEWAAQLQAGVIAEVYRDRLVGHVIRDATALPARERCRRKTAPPVQRRRRGRPRKGSPPAPKKRLDRQPGMQLAEMLDDLPKHGDGGVRFDERGRQQRWKGYKLHCDLSDSGLPLSYVLTSASLHDSQAAIPLATLTSRRVTALYELMDAGYHSHSIRQYCEQLGHVVLIPDVPPAGQPKRAFSPAQRQRYEQRRLIEQFFALLKDHFGFAIHSGARPRQGFAPGPTGHSDSYAGTSAAAVSLKLPASLAAFLGRPASHRRDVSAHTAPS